MTLEEIRKFVGYKTALVNSNGDFVDNMITLAEVDAYINARYKELFWQLAEKYSFLYEVTATYDLEANESLYTYGHDTGGDTEDLYTIRRVDVKYTDSDTVFQKAKRSDRLALLPHDSDEERFVGTRPYYFQTAIKDVVTDKKIAAIKLLPKPLVNVTGGLLITYVESPLTLVEATDTPELIPSVAHQLIAEAVIPDIWQAKGDMTKSDKTFNRYMHAEDKFFSNYQPLASDEPATFSPDREFNPSRKVV